MAYTSPTSDEVIALLTPGGAYDGVSDLTPFISTANMWIRNIVRCAALKGITFSDEDLNTIAQWLAAHFYVMSDETYLRKQTDRSSGTFKGQTGMGLKASLYGQTALDLDYSGCLNALSSGARAGAFWGGKNPPSQIPYWDRP